MSRFVKLLKQVQLPKPGEIIESITTWATVKGPWFALSVFVHLIGFASLLLLGKVVADKIEGEAPVFEADLDTVIPEADLSRFDVGDTPIENTVLDTESLMMTEAPQIEQTELHYDDNPEFIEEGGGSAVTTAAPALGGLGGFSITAIGSGPAVRGKGGVGVGVGTGSGFGSGGSGNGFGGRGQGSRKAMVGGFGGTKQSERAVAAALNWLARHQNADGSWSLTEYHNNCKDSSCTGRGNQVSNSAATAFALLPFLAAGQTHKTKGPYQKTIYRGLGWLMENQKETGDLSAGAGQTMYSHGLAAIAMCEAYGISGDRKVGESAQGGINFIEAGQDPQTGGWWYAWKQPGGDTSVFGWQLMALKSGQMAGLRVNRGTLEGGRTWLKAVSSGSQGGLFGYRPESGPAPTMTAVGLLCSQYLGAKREDPSMMEGVQYLMGQLPNNNARNCYYWYYATQVMHNITGADWDKWNRTMRRAFIDTQVKEGCAAGSWDPDKPTKDAWSDSGGRLMVTSIACLSLEVYYRYLPLYKLDKPGEKKAAATPKK